MINLKRILLIDDEVTFTDMVKLSLEQTGLYEVHVENHGTHALDTALSIKPDLILLDIIMPDQEGGEVFHLFQQNPVLKKIPIIFFTATIKPEEVKLAHGQVGGHRFLAKPSTLKELVDCIEEVTASAD